MGPWLHIGPHSFTGPNGRVLARSLYFRSSGRHRENVDVAKLIRGRNFDVLGLGLQFYVWGIQESHLQSDDLWLYYTTSKLTSGVSPLY